MTETGKLSYVPPGLVWWSVLVASLKGFPSCWKRRPRWSKTSTECPLWPKKDKSIIAVWTSFRFLSTDSRHCAENKLLREPGPSEHIALCSYRVVQQAPQRVCNLFEGNKQTPKTKAVTQNFTFQNVPTFRIAFVFFSSSFQRLKNCLHPEENKYQLSVLRRKNVFVDLNLFVS